MMQEFQTNGFVVCEINPFIPYHWSNSPTAELLLWYVYKKLYQLFLYTIKETAEYAVTEYFFLFFIVKFFYNNL